MTSRVFTPALGLLNSTVLTGDVRAALVMTNTTADTDEDAVFIADITTLDEYDGSGYARVALTGESWAKDDADDRFVFDADDFVFTGIGVGTRQCQGVLIYLHVTNDADSKPLIYIDGSGFPFNGNGEDVTFQVHADGILYNRNAD